MKAIVKNLRNGERERTALCRECGSESSADKADYFMSSDNAELLCCGVVRDIVVKRTVYEEVK